ncbi:MAG: mechanosensitive ion channel [Bacteroidaceae bacterium]|nr:mechanosensitive ion channel [Bacteroidaceae bacterium]
MFTNLSLSISNLFNDSDVVLTTFVISALLLFYIINFASNRIIVPLVKKLTLKTKSNWDDILFNNIVIKDICQLIPPIALTAASPHIFSPESTTFFWVNKVLGIYIVASFVKLACSVFNSLYLLSNENKKLKNRTLKGVFQMFKIIVICIGFIIIISIIIDKNPINILTGLGAMAAVLMLVFQDTIKGLVAGVQLSANDMLRPGDWISLPKHDADGEVIEVTLTTVKVQNWDKTITTIPPYTLVSESFQNWRGMFNSGGRRIKRSINIDMNSVGFCTEDQLEKFEKNGWLEGLPKEARIVNLTVLRNYLDKYLRNHERVNQNMTLMIRQLQPTAQGLPLELYFFSANTAWVAYEHLQADIFEHLLAMMPEFGLKVFQTPAGTDIEKGFAARNN